MERSQINQVLSEWEFGESGLVDERSAIDLGEMVGANAIIVGSITKLGDDLFRINARIVQYTC